MSRPKDGYPTPIGSSLLSIFPVTGPESYTQYTAPSTGGQDVDLLPNSGVKTADQAFGAVTTDGLHRAEVVQIEAASVNGQTLVNARLVLKWYVVATGAEVAGAVDLSGKTVYITVIGPK